MNDKGVSARSERDSLASGDSAPKRGMTPGLLEGIALFNDQKFWHAHEAWERDWLVAEGEEKLFLQGLIQLAAAYHHVQRATFAGGVRLFDAALEKLSHFENNFLGVDRLDAETRAAQHRVRIARSEHIDEMDFPKLGYN